MVTIASAENALKTLYLGVVSEQLNTQVNPLLAKIKQSTTDVWGKEVRKLVPYGANGGIGAGTEDGLLPAPAGNNYEQFQLTLKNLYGTIEISDKAMRASANNSGAFVNLLNAEMEGLVKASKFNFGRMLFGDGSGVLATVSSATGNVLTLDSVKNVMEGMVVDVLDSDGVSKVASRRITIVDRTAKSITLSGAAIAASTIAEDDVITVQGSFNKEITGLGAIFSDSDYLYGLKRSDNKWLSPKSYAATSGAIDDATIQKVIDEMEDVSGSSADFIVCSSGVRRAYQKYLAQNRTNVDVMNLEGGFKAISYNGIPGRDRPFRSRRKYVHTQHVRVHAAPTVRLEMARRGRRQSFEAGGKQAGFHRDSCQIRRPAVRKAHGTGADYGHKGSLILFRPSAFKRGRSFPPAKEVENRGGKNFKEVGYARLLYPHRKRRAGYCGASQGNRRRLFYSVQRLFQAP